MVLQLVFVRVMYQLFQKHRESENSGDGLLQGHVRW